MQRKGRQGQGNFTDPEEMRNLHYCAHRLTAVQFCFPVLHTPIFPGEARKKGASEIEIGVVFSIFQLAVFFTSLIMWTIRLPGRDQTSERYGRFTGISAPSVSAS